MLKRADFYLQHTHTHAHTHRVWNTTEESTMAALKHDSMRSWRSGSRWQQPTWHDCGTTEYREGDLLGTDASLEPVAWWAECLHLVDGTLNEAAQAFL